MQTSVSHAIITFTSIGSRLMDERRSRIQHAPIDADREILSLVAPDTFNSQNSTGSETRKSAEDDELFLIAEPELARQNYVQE